MALDIPTESLCTVAEADAWHEGRGNIAEWETLETTRKEQLLRQAFDWLIGEYRSQWPAGVTFGTVAPIVDGDPPTIAPGARAACAVLALIAKYGDLDPEVTPQLIESTVGPLTDKFAKRTTDRRFFPAVQRLMWPHLAEVTPRNPWSVPMRRG